MECEEAKDEFGPQVNNFISSEAQLSHLRPETEEEEVYYQNLNLKQIPQHILQQY